jgi:hypothetical protein
VPARRLAAVNASEARRRARSGLLENFQALGLAASAATRVEVRRLIVTLVAAAVLSSCAGESSPALRGPIAAADQAHTLSAADAAAECRALKAVTERSPLIEPPSGVFEAHLKRCGLLYSVAGGPPLQQTQFGPPMRGPEEVPIERRGNTYYVPVRINDNHHPPVYLRHRRY